MANYIKIFNDSVLKQSILQGYQAQRTNTNLGSFTMGQLAFTRDTGRVFVGNEGANQEHKENDANPVQGGILVGNKYLGMIDSKPLGHCSPNDIPLNYAVENVFYTKDSVTGKDTDTILETEQGVLLKGSIHRKDRGKHWSKDVDYIEKYDAYTGDYMFDIFNNAFILFDKNITTDETAQPRYASTLSPDKKQTFISDGGDEIDGTEVTRRTKILDNSNERNVNYPIYGDGYVIMRILEPDGITLGYKPRGYTELGIPSIDDNEDNPWENWSHNLLEIKSVPSKILIQSMSQDNFQDSQGFVRLKEIQKGIKGFSANDFILPQTITFKSNYLSTIGSDEIPMTLNFTDSSVKTQSELDYVLAVDTHNNVKIATPYRQQFNIQLKDGLINPITGEETLVLSFDRQKNHEIALGFASVAAMENEEKGSSDPFYTGTKSAYSYHGSACYDTSGNLYLSQQWDDDYRIVAEKEINQFDKDENVTVNYLKNPIPICWALKDDSGERFTTNLEFLIKPYLFCINKSYVLTPEQQFVEKVPSEPEVELPENGEDVPTTQAETEEPEMEERELTISEYNRSLSVLGNNTQEAKSQKSQFTMIDGLNCEPWNADPYKNYSLKDSEGKYITESLFYTNFFIDQGRNKNNQNLKEWKSLVQESDQGKTVSYQYVKVEDIDNANLYSIYAQAQPENIDYRPKEMEMTTADDIKSIPAIFTFTYFKIEGEYRVGERYDNALMSLGTLTTQSRAIKKIQISTNNPNNRLFTIMEDGDELTAKIVSLLNDTQTKHLNYKVKKDSTSINLYLVKNNEGTQVTVYVLTNSKLFIDKETVPYYITLTTSYVEDDVVYEDEITSKLNGVLTVTAPKILEYTITTADKPNVFYALDNQSVYNEVGEQIQELVGVNFMKQKTVTYEGEGGLQMTRIEILPQHSSMESFISGHCILSNEYSTEYTYEVEQGGEIEWDDTDLDDYDDEIVPSQIITKKYTAQVKEYTINSLDSEILALTFVSIKNRITSFNADKKVIEIKDGVENIKTTYNKQDETGEAYYLRISYTGNLLETITNENGVTETVFKQSIGKYGESTPYLDGVRYRKIAKLVNIKDENDAIIGQEMKFESCPVSPNYPESYLNNNTKYNKGNELYFQEEMSESIEDFAFFDGLVYWSKEDDSLETLGKKVETIHSSTGGDGTVTETKEIKYIPRFSLPEVIVNTGIILTETYILKAIPTYKSGYIYPENISFDKNNKVVIPDNASSIILEVNQKNTSDETINILTAENIDYLFNTFSDNNTSIDFPFIAPEIKTEVPEQGEEIWDNTLPNLDDTLISPNEKIIYSSNKSGSQIIEIPLYRTGLNNAKGFCMRINNTPTKNDKFLIRVIGYRA